MEDAIWSIKVSDAGVQLTRIHNGKPNESYRAVDHARGAIFLAAISQGFQPPRDLRCLDKPVG